MKRIIIINLLALIPLLCLCQSKDTSYLYIDSLNLVIATITTTIASNITYAENSIVSGCNNTITEGSYHTLNNCCNVEVIGGQGLNLYCKKNLRYKWNGTDWIITKLKPLPQEQYDFCVKKGYLGECELP